MSSKLPWDTTAAKVRQKGGYQRERSADPYHSARWTRLSRGFRLSHPFCAECARNGIAKAADVTDHIIPWPVCKDFFDESNLQALCEECNHAKGQRDKAVIRQWRLNHER